MVRESEAPHPETCHVEGNVDGIRSARRWLSDRLSAAGCPGDCAALVLLGVGEALTNIVKHGYRNRPEEVIELSLVLAAGRVEITILDAASPFQPVRKDPPPPEILAEGGYGLYLIHTIMDEVRYDRTPEGRNRLWLSKSFTSPGRRAAS